MNKPAAYIIGGISAYMVYRYFQTSGDADFSIGADLSSTLQTFGEYVNPTQIPFSCVDPKTGRDYKSDIQAAARLTGVPALLLASLIRQESAFNSRARNSSSGAMGLGQFMPATAAEWFGATWQNGVYDPDRAIPMTARYLAWLYRRHGTWRVAVAAYNWGTGNLAKYGLAGMPAETRHYVSVVYDRWSKSLPA